MFSTSALCLTQYWNIPDSEIAYVSARPTNPGSLSSIYDYCWVKCNKALPIYWSVGIINYLNFYLKKEARKWMPRQPRKTNSTYQSWFQTTWWWLGRDTIPDGDNTFIHNGHTNIILLVKIHWPESAGFDTWTVAIQQCPACQTSWWWPALEVSWRYGSREDFELYAQTRVSTESKGKRYCVYRWLQASLHLVPSLGSTTLEPKRPLSPPQLEARPNSWQLLLL